MNLEDIFSRLDTIHERDGQTDTGRQQVPRLRIASLGKNLTATVASLVDTYFRSSWNWNVVLFRALNRKIFINNNNNNNTYFYSAVRS